MVNEPATALHPSYDPEFFARIVEIEDRHFWYRARNRTIAAAVSNTVSGLPRGYRVLEAGCGTGVVLRQLAETCRNGEVMGIDLYPEAVAFASQRAACRVIEGDMLNPPPLDEFDVVCMFDVLEHLPNESKVLSGLSRVLKPGGALILTVPAHMSLWSYFDLSACHCRRYESVGLTRILRENGFEVEYLTEFMTILFPFMWLLRRLKGGNTRIDQTRAAGKASSELKIVPVINSLFRFILSAEALAIQHRWRLPIGTSLLAVARKK